MGVAWAWRYLVPKSRFSLFLLSKIESRLKFLCFRFKYYLTSLWIPSWLVFGESPACRGEGIVCDLDKLSYQSIERRSSESQTFSVGTIDFKIPMGKAAGRNWYITMDFLYKFSASNSEYDLISSSRIITLRFQQVGKQKKFSYNIKRSQILVVLIATICPKS